MQINGQPARRGGRAQARLATSPSEFRGLSIRKDKKLVFERVKQGQSRSNRKATGILICNILDY